MSRFAKRRNIGLMIALALLVVVSGLGFATRSSNSSSLASSRVPAMPANGKAAAPAAASAAQNGTTLPNGFTVASDVKHDVSPALRDIPAAAEIPHRMENENSRRSAESTGPQGASVDPVIQKSFGPLAMPTPLITWQGVNNHFGGWPPDTQGDVGPNNYVQFINVHFQIWDKAGNSLYGPVPGNTLWTGFGGACQTSNDGDPITLYDAQANRWLMSQFASPNYPNGPFYQCIAISTTGDPTGSYNRYSFVTSANKLNDYPHFGIWPDGYYMTANLFDTSSNWAGTGVYAFDRASMLAGTPATMQLRELPITDWGGMLPSDMDGT